MRVTNTHFLALTHTQVSSTNTSGGKKHLRSEPDTQRERDSVRFPSFSSHAPATSVHSGVQMLLFAFFLCSGWGGGRCGPSQEEEEAVSEMETEGKQRECEIVWKSGDPLVPFRGLLWLRPVSDVSQSSSSSSSQAR